ncbi:MAG: hypothetical protein GC160_26655 [Acidobacteria bacterium]|nr:hypothetical protein [Acidobacteriota bacterium]
MESYRSTFIAVAPDTTAVAGTEPPERSGPKTIARLEYELISSQPYALTQEEVLFRVHTARRGLPSQEVSARRSQLWNEFFSKPMACLRASPLPKTYGWGLHFDAKGRVALVGVESAEYRRLSADASLAQVPAMRSKRH